MNKGMFFRVLACILFLGVCVYSYLDLQNEITGLRIRIPHLSSEVRKIEEENMHLLYQIERFESPENLMNLAKLSEFAYLKYPTNQEVITLAQASPIDATLEKTPVEIRTKPTIRFATSANP